MVLGDPPWQAGFLLPQGYHAILNPWTFGIGALSEAYNASMNKEMPKVDRKQFETVIGNLLKLKPIKTAPLARKPKPGTSAERSVQSSQPPE